MSFINKIRISEEAFTSKCCGGGGGVVNPIKLQFLEKVPLLERIRGKNQKKYDFIFWECDECHTFWLSKKDAQNKKNSEGTDILEFLDRKGFDFLLNESKTHINEKYKIKLIGKDSKGLAAELRTY